MLGNPTPINHLGPGMKSRSLSEGPLLPTQCVGRARVCLYCFHSAPKSTSKYSPICLPAPAVRAPNPGRRKAPPSSVQSSVLNPFHWNFPQGTSLLPASIMMETVLDRRDWGAPGCLCCLISRFGICRMGVGEGGWDCASPRCAQEHGRSNAGMPWGSSEEDPRPAAHWAGRCLKPACSMCSCLDVAKM